MALFVRDAKFKVYVSIAGLIKIYSLQLINELTVVSGGFCRFSLQRVFGWHTRLNVLCKSKKYPELLYNLGKIFFWNNFINFSISKTVNDLRINVLWPY